MSAAEQVAEVRYHLEHTLMPALDGPHARVSAEMLGDVLAMVERRLTLEPAWLAEESETMAGLIDRASRELAVETEPTAVEALAAANAALTADSRAEGFARYGLAALEARYRQLSDALELVVRALGFVPGPARFDDLTTAIRAYIRVRVDREFALGGDAPARGRG